MFCVSSETYGNIT